MSSAYWERVKGREGAAVLVASDVPVAAVIARLEAGESPAGVVGSLGLEPSDVVAALAYDALGEGDQGPALVQTPPRRPALERALSEAAWAELYPRSEQPVRLALAAGLLQIHDFWDASHHAAQEADDLGESRVSAYWHGIGHRREPDAGNAAYWFRRVGEHPLFEPLAESARAVLEADNSAPALLGQLMPRGAWDPFAFINLCTSGQADHRAVARKLQRLEMILLLGVSIPA